MIAEGNRNQCRQMKNRITAPQCISDTVRIPDISGKDFNILFFFLRKGIDPSPASQRIIVDKRPDIKPFTNKELRQMAADKSACTGHKDFTHVEISFLSNISLNFCSFRWIPSLLLIRLSTVFSHSSTKNFSRNFLFLILRPVRRYQPR